MTEPQTKTELSQGFKMILFVVILFTALSFLASALLSWAPETESTKQVLETSLTTFKLGFGALIGLIGGKQI